MNRELRSKVLLIAKRVRQWTQEKAEKAKYNTHTLCGWCAISSAHLFRELRKENIQAELHYVSGHCFVVVDDYIVDVTATQFSELDAKDVFIMHHKAAQEYWFYRTEQVFYTPSELREHQFRESWPRKQICYTR